MSERTIEMYVRAVRLLSRHFHRAPDKITNEELRQYFLFNKNERRWSRTASTIALCGIKLFYTMTLKKDWTPLKFVRPEKQKTLPVVLSKDEVQKILKSVRMSHHRVCLTTIYSLGLRLQEGTHPEKDRDRLSKSPISIPSACSSISIAGKETRIGMSHFLNEPSKSSETSGKPTVIPSGSFPHPAGVDKPVKKCRPLNNPSHSPVSRSPSRRPKPKPASRKRSLSIICGITMPPTCWRQVSTYVSCRNTWVITIPKQP